jgi:molybdopterin converting factor small subunit
MNDTVNSLRDRITADMKDAMRAKATARLSTIRLLLAAIKQREVDERKTLSDADVVAVIDKMVKQRRDSITQFDAGNRADYMGEGMTPFTPYPGRSGTMRYYAVPVGVLESAPELAAWARKAIAAARR